MMELADELIHRTLRSGGRVLAQEGELYREVAALFEAYLARNKLDPSQPINLPFHTAQCLTFTGDAKSVRDARGHLKQARNAVGPPDSSLS